MVQVVRVSLLLLPTVEYTIVVKQGTVTAIDQTKYLFDNKRYNLLGIEVDENYKGVVIRNGEKFIQ